MMGNTIEMDSAFYDMKANLEKLGETSSYKKNKEYIQHALEQYPDDVYLLTCMSYVEYRMKHYDIAMDYVKQAEKIDPNFGYLLCHKAWLLYDRDSFAEGLEAWQVVIDTPLEELVSEKYEFDLLWARSRQMDAYYYCAMLLWSLKRFDEAEIYAKRHLEMRKRGLWSNFSKKRSKSFFVSCPIVTEINLQSQMWILEQL